MGRKSLRILFGERFLLSQLIDPYIEVVKEFLTSFERPLTVCDLGCGDFNVGNYFLPFVAHFQAVDIVPDLIVYHTTNYQRENLSFHCLDIAVDTLPVGDFALVRQVLQHLSNEKVQGILDKLQQFRFVLLTEHLP